MRSWLLLFVFLCVSGAAADGTGICAELPSRRVVSLAAIERERQAALAKAPSLEQRLALSRLLYYEGKYTDDRKLRAKLFDESMALTEAAHAEAPRHPGALLGFAAARGELARTSGILTALSYVKDVRDALETLKEIQPSYEGFAADRGLAIVYHEAPSLFSIGSGKRSRAALAAMMLGDPTHPGNQIVQAQYFARTDEISGARALAKKVWLATSDPRWAVEAFEWGRQACEILRESGE